MSNETSSSVDGATPNTGSPATGPASGSETQPKAAMTLEEAQARIAELEHANRNATEERDRHRKKLSTYEDAERKAQEAALSDVEKATKRASEAEERVKQYQQRLVSAQVQLAAQKLGIIDPELAALAISGKLEMGDDGLPTNIDALLKDLVKNKPYLVKAAEQTTTPSQTAPNASSSIPQIPAMNPGRSTIPQPGTFPPGKIPRLTDVFGRKPN